MVSNQARILIAGDVYPSGIYEKIFTSSIDHIREFWNDIYPLTLSHDLNILNLECPLTKRGKPIIKSGPHLVAKPECVDGLREGGFSLFSLANNHILDMGTDGILDTLQICRENEILTVGAGENLSTASKPIIIEINKVKIGICAFTENEFSIAEEDTAGACPLDLISNYSMFKELKKEVDFIVVIIHGGNEYHPLPSPGFKKICHFYIDSGANAIICHHSHVPGGYEVYNQAPIFYGIGNFIFDWPNVNSPEWFKGYFVSLELIKNSAPQFSIIPFIQSIGEAKIKLLKNAELSEFIFANGKLSSIVSDDKQLEFAWQKLVREKSIYYLGAMFTRSQIETKLLDIGFFPHFIFYKNIPKVLNTIRCESHRELLTSVLKAIIKSN